MATPPPLSLSVLGPLRLRSGNVSIGIRGTLKNRLLARLALTPEQPVSADSLIDALWGDQAPRTARQSVHVHISNLRDRLRPHDADRIIATTVEGHYRLGVGPEAIDAWRFEARAIEGHAALRSGNHRRARDLLADAVDMWGEPFVDLADCPAAIGERHRLTALQESVVDSLAASLVDLGDLGGAIALLRSVVATAPLRERPYGLLIRAYSELGEPAQAVAAFENARAVLRNELGVEPSSELVELAENSRHSHRRGATQSGAPTGLDIDLSVSTMARVEPGADLRPLLDAIGDASESAWRKVAHGRLTSGGDALPMAPMFELSGLAGRTRLVNGDDRRALYTKVTDALVARHSATPVVVIEGIEQAGDLLIDYLRHSLRADVPPPFTAVLIDTGTVPGSPAAQALSGICVQTLAPELPQTVPLAERLDGLSDDDQHVLAFIVAATRPVATELVALASELPMSRAAVAIDRLIARNLVLLEPTGRLDLRSPMELDHVVGLLRSEPAQLHQALAEALGRTATRGNDHHIAEARHRLSALPAGSPDLAWSAALTALDDLESLGAYREILVLIESTIGRDYPWPAQRSSLWVLVRYGRALIRCGNSIEGRAMLERAIDASRELGDAVLFADAVRYLAEERAPQQQEHDVRELVAEALDMLGPEPTDTRIQLMTDLANSAYLTDPERAELLGTQALADARGAPPATQARAITGYIQTLMRADTAERRRQLAIEAQQLARRSDSTESLVLALTYEAMTLIELEEPRRAEAPLRYAEALAADVQVPRFQWWAASWLALLDFILGERTDVEERFGAAFELWPTSTRTDPFECFASQIAMLRLLENRGAELLGGLGSLTGPDAEVAYVAPAAAAFAQAGLEADAVAAVDRLLAPGVLDERRDITMPFCLALAAEAADRVGYADAGPRLVELIEPIAGAQVLLNVWGGGGFYWGSLQHGYGLALELAGRRDEAQAALRDALNVHQRMGVPIFAARSRGALAAIS